MVSRALRSSASRAGEKRPSAPRTRTTVGGARNAAAWAARLYAALPDRGCAVSTARARGLHAHRYWRPYRAGEQEDVLRSGCVSLRTVKAFSGCCWLLERGVRKHTFFLFVNIFLDQTRRELPKRPITNTAFTPCPIPSAHSDIFCRPRRSLQSSDRHWLLRRRSRSRISFDEVS